jgi:hypothetical protein
VTRTPSSMILIIAVMLAIFGGMAIAAQDKYTLKLGKLSFSDFRGYENYGTRTRIWSRSLRA